MKIKLDINVSGTGKDKLGCQRTRPDMVAAAEDSQ